MLHPFPKASRFASALLFAALAVPAFAQTIVADFTQGVGTTSASHQYVGAAGDGWSGAWNLSTQTNATATAAVRDTTPIAGSTHRLEVNVVGTGSSSTTRRSTLNRAFNPSASIVSAAHQISFNIRFDDLSGYGANTPANDNFGIFAASSATSTTGTASQTWGIQALSGGNFFLHDGDGSDNSTLIDTGLAPVQGRTYAFVIKIDPTAHTWMVTIDDGVNDSFTSTTLGFRRNSSAGNVLHFNTQMSSPDDNWTYSIDGLTISAVPEPASAGLLAGGAAALLLFGRRGARRASL